MPLLYGFDEDPDDELELLSVEALDELSELLLSVSPELSPMEISTEVLSETSVPDVLEELDELDELEELVVVESELSELSGSSNSLPELSQPLSRAVIIKDASMADSCFFMSSPLLRYPRL